MIIILIIFIIFFNIYISNINTYTSIIINKIIICNALITNVT